MRDPLPDYVDWRRFVHSEGPGRSFVRWLSFLIPPGAEVIPIGADVEHGTRNWPTDVYLTFGAPLIVDAATPPYLRSRAWRRVEVAERMPLALYRSSGTRAPRPGYPMWTMKAAFFRHICGYSTGDIARMMELRDEYTLGVEDRAGRNSRSGRNYVELGGVALAKLGAWPWCLGDSDGRLDKDWYRQQRFAEALATWHYQQTLSSLVATLAPVGWAASGEGLHRGLLGSGTTMDLARAAYRDAYVRSVKEGADQ